jgi:NDP-sugar pyrophosphorylase family protein
VIASHALVLAAGLGTRLRPLTLGRAKPAVPVAGEPLARRIVGWLAAQGVTDITLNLHYLPESIAARIGDGSDLGATVRYSWEQPQVLGSAGGPRLALDIIGAERFWIVNGDTITDVSLAALHEAHCRTGAAVTMALVPNTQPAHYGGMQLDDDGRIRGFVKKGPDASGSFHFVGVQLVESRVFASLRPGEPASTVRGIYDALIDAEPGAVRGFVSSARFWDIGTIEDYRQTTREWRGGAGNSFGARVSIDPTAAVSDSILWDDVSVGHGAIVTDCIVTDDVTIEPGATFRHAILWRETDGRLAHMPIDGRLP